MSFHSRCSVAFYVINHTNCCFETIKQAAQCSNICVPSINICIYVCASKHVATYKMDTKNIDIPIIDGIVSNAKRKISNQQN